MKFLTEKITSVKNAVIEDFTSNKKLTADQRDRKRTRMIGRITAGMMAVMMLTSMFGITAFAEHRRRRWR